MFFHLRCVAILGLLSWPYATAQSFQNASSTQPTLSATLGATGTPSPSRALNSSSSHGSIESCNSAWQSYKSRMTRPYTTDTVTVTKTLSVSTSLMEKQTCSSYCGTICYADTLSAKTVLVPGTYTETEYSYSSRLTYSGPAPNCTVPAADCKQLWTSYTSADVAWSKTGGMGSPLTPGCTAGCQRTTCRFGGGGKGAIPTPGVQERYWNSLKLFYFPETRNVSRDMCAHAPTQTPVPPVSYSSYIPTTTEGFVIQDGKTLYKGNVYISVDQLEVGDNCGYTTVMHDIAFPVASSDVQSQRANEPVSSKYWPVNWADFNEPVPYSAYIGGQGMSFSAINPGEIFSSSVYCKTAICDRAAVLPGEYNPWMILPLAIKNLDPEFADCEIPDGYTWFDPPIALHGAPNFLTTKSPDPASTPATPASSMIALPVQTSNPAPADPPSSASASPPYDNPPYDPPTNNPSSYHPPKNNNPLTNNKPPKGDPTNAANPPNAKPPNTNPPTNDPPSDDPAPGGQNPNNPTYTRPAQADPASRPQITVGPTIIPIAPDGQGLVIHSPTTIPPSGSAVIGSTTFHLSSGVLSMVSPGGTSSITLGDAAQNGVGTVVGLGHGGSFTITTAGSSLVFDVKTTIANGDPAQTVGDMVVSVGSDGVHISNVKNGEQTSVAFTDVEGVVTGSEGSFNAAAFTGATFGDEGFVAASAYSAGVSTGYAQSGPVLTSGLEAASTGSSGDGSGSARIGAHSASGTGSAGSGGSESETGAPSSSTSGLNKGAASSMAVPWYLGLLSMCMFVSHL
ncbi:hypothetical protein P171DRAFT_428809 [Karstenula rhodostoma CBS 690.94]|uniref:Uncharacterized protein n=1 Tax=Karstenula rhodostoma CBS 690.94 TaxID=1392251 RepID=A0A9P4PRF7_9PLEO|nr:hypothetical protein P171DRAFT_428809 [Karstenula rhodostoma CBS 690.94]